jgi:hypothetical protein
MGKPKNRSSANQKKKLASRKKRKTAGRWSKTAASLKSKGIKTMTFNVELSAGIAAFLGFIIGSVPPRGENRGWEFDLKGALSWMITAAGIVGGIAQYLSTGRISPAIYAVAIAVLVAFFRWYATRPPREPHDCILSSGVNRISGAGTQAQKFKKAERRYKNASFSAGSSSRFAARSPTDFRFGKNGIDAHTLGILKESVEDPYPEVFDILVILMRELPTAPGEPAVVVVRGSQCLRTVKIESDGLTVPGYNQKLPASAVAGVVGYAWR